MKVAQFKMRKLLFKRRRCVWGLLFCGTSPGLVFIDTETGGWRVDPAAANVGSKFKATLTAFTVAGVRAALKQWVFTVKQRPLFTTTSAWEDQARASSMTIGNNYLAKYAADPPSPPALTVI